MRVLVTGASGFVGLRVCRHLAQAGFETIGLVHSAPKKGLVESTGATAVVGDLDQDSAYEHAKNVDAIVHCAQVEFYTKRASRSAIQGLSSSDLRWTKRLLEAGAGRAKAFLYSSGNWIYGDTGDRIADETSPVHPMPGAEHKAEGERLVFEEGRRLGYQSCVALRLGTVYGTDGVFDKFVLGPMRTGGKSRFLGSGQQGVSLVHVDDAARGYVLALQKLPGFEVINLCDDEPVEVKKYVSYLAEQMGAKPPGGAPVPMVKLFIGATAIPLSSTVRASNAKAKRVLGWQPKYPTYREGMTAIAREVRGAKSAA